MNRKSGKRYIVNIIFIVLIIVLSLFCLGYYFSNNSSNISQVDQPSIVLEKENNVLDNLDVETQKHTESTVWEGYLNIRAVVAGSEEKSQEIKLFIQDNNAYFFMPSYCKENELSISFQQEDYEIYLNKNKLCSGDKLPATTKSNSILRVVSVQQKESNIPKDAEYILSIIYSNKLPAVFISTANGTMDYINDKKDNEEPGELICVNSDGSIDCVGELDKIKMHGNTSLSCMKKTYQINFNESVDMMEMGRSNKWILQANSYDRSYMRNKLSYDIAKRLELKYAIDAEYADVYFNNEYAGNYLVCEKVEVAKNRVDIPDLDEQNIYVNNGFSENADIIDIENARYYDILNNPKDISGGYLLEINNLIKQSDNSRIKKEDCYFTTASTIYEIKSPEKISEQEMAYISSYMKKVEELIKECDTAEKYYELKEYIDIDSFVNMYIINAITNEVDTNNYSTFYFKQSDTNGGKLYAGPVWDYDRAFGNEERNIYYNLNGFNNGLSEQLYENVLFRQEVVNKFNQNFSDLYKENIEILLDEMSDVIGRSVFMNDIRWKSDLDRLNYSYDTFEDEISYLKYYFYNRFEIVEGYLNQPDNYKLVEFINSDETVTQCWIKQGDVLTDEIIRTMNHMYNCNFWVHQSGNRYQQGRPVFNDMVLYAGIDENSDDNKAKQAVKETKVENEGDNGMNWLAFIMIMTPGIIPLFISGNNSINKINELPQFLMRYFLNSFIIIMMVYGILYVMKGPVLFSFSQNYSEEYYYTIFHTNAVFIYMILSLAIGVALGIVQKILKKKVQ